MLARTPSLRGVLSALLPVLALACGDRSGQTPEEPAHAAAPPAAIPEVELHDVLEAGTWSETQLGLRMLVPDGFESRTDFPDGRPLPEGARVLVDPARPAATLNLVVGERKGSSLEELLVARVQQIRHHCPGFVLLAAGSHFTPSGRVGKVLDYQWLVQGEILRQRQALFVTRDWSFTWTATWPAGQGPETEGDVLAPALASFEFDER